MPRSEACWHCCPCCKKDFFHEVDDGAPLDVYFSPCQSCRPEGAVASKSASAPKELMWADEGEEVGRGALVGIARDAFAQAFEPGLSELEVVDLPEGTR
jgi:hypothetical protein